MACIFCLSNHALNTVEHIVPESLGNIQYVLSKGDVCDGCNERFSKFEKKALDRSILGFERLNLGVKTKKNKPASWQQGKGKRFHGDKGFRPGYLIVPDLKKKDFMNDKTYDPKKQTIRYRVESFEQNENPTSKVLLKMAFEALFKSKNDLWRKYEFEELKAFLAGDSNIDWPFIMPTNQLIEFESIPEGLDKGALDKIPCRLLISEVDSKNLIFRFEYGNKPIAYEINLLNRSLEWIKPHKDEGNIFCVFPRHFDKALGIPPEGNPISTLKPAGIRKQKSKVKRKKSRKMKSRVRQTIRTRRALKAKKRRFRNSHRSSQ